MYHFVRTLFFKKRISALNQFFIFVKGVSMGMVELIPGVGIATLSLSFNIYHEFIGFLHDVSTVFKELSYLLVGRFETKSFKKSLNTLASDFSIPLFLGIIFGLFIFSFILRFTLENLPAYINALFFGLVLASISVPLRQIKNISVKDKIFMFLSFCIFFFLFGFHSSNIFYIPSSLIVFISGFFTSLTLVLPGLGGASALVIFGVYTYMLDIITHLFSSTLTADQAYSFVIFLLGLFLGFVVIVRVLKRVIKSYKSIVMASLSGIMIASLRALYPFITIKGDTTIISTPWELPAGHSIIIFVVIIVSYTLTKVLNDSVKSKDPVEDA